MDCFYAQMDYFVKMHCSETNLVDYAHKQLAPIPLVSTFVDGCLQKGKDVTDGGAYLNSTNIVGLGTANCVDGLYSVKELVYDKKTMTLQEFREILKNNYEDQEPLRQMITNKLPKFGNDVDDVDDLAVQVTNHFFDELDKYKTYHNGEFWMALYSVTSQVGMGQLTGAGADGRLARETLADGLTPMYGQDRNGPTASLKSFSKIDLSHAPGGVIVNQRFTSSVFANEKNRKKLAQLFRSFVELGGFHWQFNIVSTDTMRAAQKNPHEYRDLVVRVAGYSAIFIELSDVAQESVIARNAATI